ncbi:uncharacterized protein LOC124125607 isoform X1 [Haliotis rufescens]|uniref:uncharacterized protein LOC124125607 isoform X1 n=1 Tax=Haliotis rufescens TaxID=6454 RepID=UPI00201F0522|nr:uncharacterized protein LOC124125607 isoform X1 [Haliotis rufescens]
MYRDSCFHSHSTAPNPTWTVDLGQPYRIHDVRIYNRVNYPQLIRTAVLSLSNSSSSIPGVTCYTFPNDAAKTNNSVYDVTCDGTGRYFTITHSTGLNLCEVEINVCSPGVFGDSCNQFCHCFQATCDPVSGVCPGDCRPGWQGDRCDTVCSNGSYGPKCSNMCTHRNCAGDSPCDHMSGTCVSGCKAGWMGDDCMEVCSNGSYGQNCHNSCTDRKCAGDSTCGHINGTCVSGCAPGWMGEDCREGCSNGSYGQNCNNSCPDRKCAGDSPCDHIRGTCVSGCATGWMGEDCREACSNGSYGQNCNNSCTDRKCAGDSPCDHVRGTCVSGCEPGWMGDDCREVCDIGRYGANCDKTCSSRHCVGDSSCYSTGHCDCGCVTGWTGADCTACSNGSYGQNCSNSCTDRKCAGDSPCDHISGTCVSGCAPGWMGEDCREGCSNGSYGQNCNKSCTDRKCAGDSPCDHIRGTCVSGCAPGWMGEDCREECSNGSYGQNCNKSCTDRKCGGDSPCDHIRGTCVSGCAPGWMGEDCREECSNGSYGQNCNKSCTDRKCGGDSPCDHIRGTCVSGCAPGWIGEDCREECLNGSYGQKCNKSCTDRKCGGDSPCDHIRGTCVSGCAPGWMGEDCREECSNGSYGQKCNKSCTDRKCAGDSSCDHIRGTCVSGCAPGWMGENCREVCDTGRYAANCDKTCASRHCVGNSSCNSTGDCDTGCETGWTGADCTVCSSGRYGQKCNNSCTDRKCAGDSTCDHINGTCVSGCAPGWMGEDCKEVQTQASASPAVPVAAVGGAVAGLVLLVLVLVLLIIRRRRNRGNRPPDGPVFDETSPRNRKLLGADNVYMNVGFEENKSVPKKGHTLTIADKDHGHQEHTQEADSQSVANQEEDDKDAHVNIHPKGEAVPGVSGCSYYNLGDLGHVIPLSSLEARVLEIKNHPQEAFERLPGGFTHSYGESQKAGNKGKNRFKGYYPYDYNRVVLHDDSDDSRGDYINASYLDGYKTDNRYIAAQGPYKSDIVEDFWRMIWQEGCTSIVMVTGLVEAGKVKCLQYWPSGKVSEKFGDVMVTVETETRLANYTITKLAVENEKESERRDVYHLHFSSWPDHGVPDTAALLDFMWRVKVISGQQTEPIIVHCSAGIGRTGTYIAIESLVEQAKSEGVVDVVSFVSNMRGQRKNMIQTKEQYLFVYQAVARAMTEGDTSLDCDVIREINLDDMSDFAMGNRTVQQHIKVLQSEIQGQPDDSPITTVPSYTSRNGFVIMTSHPNKEEVWETLYNSDCRSIFTYPTHDQSYLPTAETSVTTKRFEVTTPLSDNILLNTVEVKLKDSGEVTVIQHYHNTGSARDVELDLLIDSLLTWTNDPERVCSMIISDCMSECRLLVLLVNIASRLQDDGRVDVINNMRQLYTRLGGPPFTEADVRLCLEFTQRRLEARGVYANM